MIFDLVLNLLILVFHHLMCHQAIHDRFSQIECKDTCFSRLSIAKMTKGLSNLHLTGLSKYFEISYSDLRVSNPPELTKLGRIVVATHNTNRAITKCHVTLSIKSVDLAAPNI